VTTIPEFFAPPRLSVSAMEATIRGFVKLAPASCLLFLDGMVDDDYGIGFITLHYQDGLDQDYITPPPVHIKHLYSMV
jgi:hypothetical protein